MARRVLIIGAGVIGLCTAYYCARRGFAVTVVERNAAQRDGCSFGNAGLIVPSHFIPLASPGMVALGLKWMWNPASPFFVRPRLDPELLGWGMKFWRAANAGHVRRAAPLLRDLSLASRECFENLAAQTGNEFNLVEKGLLMLCGTQHTLDKEARIAEQARALGIPADILNPAQTAALEPNVRMNAAGAVFFPRDSHLAPDRFMASLQNQSANAGANYIWNAEVTGWQIERDRHIRAVKLADGREVESDEFILCGGSWSPVIARGLGLKIPLQAGKGYSLTLPDPRQRPHIPAIFTEARVAVTPINGGLRFGGTMEINGLNESINPARVRGIIDAVPRYYPGFQTKDFDGIQPWRGLRPCSPDGLPLVGRTGRFANLSLATGHAMMGLSLGPITGKLLAEILSGERPVWDIRMLSPDRYC